MALTALKVTRLAKPGLYPDSDGLYLRISDAGTKSWLYRFMLAGRRRWMGLGPFPLISLADARAKALDARRLRHERVDPIDARRSQRAAQRLQAVKGITFKECAAAYVKAHRAAWTNPKHAAQWEATLETYAYPVIGSLPVAAIDTGLVIRCIEPIWTTKNETASRIRGRIESVLDWARVKGYRSGENPARWRGHLDHLLPPKTVQKRGHFAALPYNERLRQTASIPGHQRGQHPLCAQKAAPRDHDPRVQIDVPRLGRRSHIIRSRGDRVQLGTRGQ